jgi:hypothetical protein
MIGIILLLILGLILAMRVILIRLFNEKVAFIVISGIPLASCLLLMMFMDFLSQVFDFGVVALGVAMLLMSVSLGLVGIVLAVNAYRRGEGWRGLLMATLVAYAPVALAVGVFG